MPKADVAERVSILEARMGGFSESLRRVEHRVETCTGRQDFLAENLTEVRTTVNRIDRTQQDHGRILESHGKTLDEHGRMLEDHTRILEDHTRILEDHTRILEGHGRTLETHTRMLDGQTKTLDEHGKLLRQILSRLDRD